MNAAAIGRGLDGEALFAGRAAEQVREAPERLGGLGLRAGDDDRDPLVDRPGDLPVRRDEDVGRASENRLDVGLADADAAVRAVQQQVDAIRVVLHEIEGLEPELRVLEGERVEHSHHDDVGRAVDRRDHLCGETWRRVHDDPVELAAQDRVDLAKQLCADGARLVGAARGDERPHSGGVGREEGVELVVVDRTGGLREVVDGSLGRKAEAERDVAELEVEVDERDALAALGEGDREVRRRQGLSRPALRPEDADEPRVIRSSGSVGSLLPGEELVDLEAHLVPRGREHDDVVGSGLECAPEEPVRRPVPEHDDRQLGVVPGDRVEQEQRPVRVAGTGDEEHVGRAVA